MQDENAERCIVGCALHQRREYQADPLWISHEGRRSLYLAAMLLGQRGFLHTVPRFGCPAEISLAVRANAAIVAEAVERTGTWEVAGDPRDELRWCLNVLTCPAYLDGYCERLRVVYERRERLLQLESEMQELIGGAA